MTARQREPIPDLLKGTALVLMVQVHIMELFADPSISTGWLGKASLLLGGPPVAPVFLGLMGYFAGRPGRSQGGGSAPGGDPHQAAANPSTMDSWPQAGGGVSLLKRASLLLGLGLLLNLGLNAHLLWRIQRGLSPLDPWGFVFGVDILFLAGLSLLVIAAARPLLGGHPWPWALAAVGAVLLTPGANEVVDRLTAAPNEAQAGITWLACLLAYVAGTCWWSYFPLFPWLAYPLLGVAVRLWQQREAESGQAWVFEENPWRVHLITLVLPAAVLAITGRWAISVAHDLSAYYHHGAQFFLWVVLFLVLWARGHALADRYLGRMPVACWLKWMGRHVTAIYFFQWLLIGNIATAVYKTQSLRACVCWFVAVLAIANVLTAVTGSVWSGFPSNRR